MKRFLSLVLCFVLLCSFVVSPIRANALISEAATAGYIVVRGMLIEVTEEFSKFVASTIVGSLPDVKMSYEFFKGCLDVGTIIATRGMYKPFVKDFNEKTESSDGSSFDPAKFEVTKEILLDLANACLESNSAIMRGLAADLKMVAQTIGAKISLYVPPQNAWYQAEEITYDRLTVSGFSDIAELNKNIETLNDNVLAGNSISWQIMQKLMQLIGYLRTDFLDFFEEQFELLATRLSSTFENVQLTMPDVYIDMQSFADSLASLEAAIGKMQDKLAGLLTTINSTLGDLEDTLSDDLGTLNESIKTLNANMNTWDRTLIDRVLENLQQIKKYQVDGSSSVVENLQQVKKNQVLIYDRLYEVVTNVNTNITSLKTNLVYRLQLLETAINNLIKKVEDIAATLTDYVDVTVKDTILVPKPEVTVDVGEQQILVSDYATAQTAFSLKLGWVTDLFDFLRELFNRIVYAEEPPKVMLNLSKAEGSYNIGADTVMIDLSWYKKYKAIGDLLLSGILWIAFCMHAYRRTPDILSGVGATVRSVGRGSDH